MFNKLLPFFLYSALPTTISCSLLFFVNIMSLVLLASCFSLFLFDSTSRIALACFTAFLFDIIYRFDCIIDCMVNIVFDIISRVGCLLD